MINPIAPIAESLRPIAPITAGTASSPGTSFVDTLRNAVAEVDKTQHAAEKAAENFATGRSTDVAATMITVERAAITLQLMLQIRNRLLDAYQEIQRLQV